MKPRKNLQGGGAAFLRVAMALVGIAAVFPGKARLDR